VILPAAHPFEYFRADWNANDPRLPSVPHPRLPGSVLDPQHATASAPSRPLYFQITLRRSLLGLPWPTRYAAGVLFKKYSPAKRYRPGVVDARISTNTVIFREASSEVAALLVQLKEIVRVENVWTVEEYRESVRKLLGKKALTETELQERRGYFVVKQLQNN
jgi:hypothetical protein